MKCLIFLLFINAYANPISDWKVESLAEDSDGVSYLGQEKSLIDWKEIDSNDWLDFKKWEKERDFKDKNPNWKLKLRQRINNEKIATVISCKGQCFVDHGNGARAIFYNSSLFEGDEVTTLKASTMWLVLLNGAIIRISSDSSVSLNEINFSKKGIFTALRLNQGQIYYESRITSEYKVLNLPETDQIILPIKEEMANREYFEIKEYRSLEPRMRALYESEKNPGARSQYNFLNFLLKEKEDFLSSAVKQTMITSSNFNLRLKGGNYTISAMPNAPSFIKYKKSSFNIKAAINSEAPKLNIRDHFNYVDLEEGSYRIEAHGEKFTETSNIFKKIDLNIKRIPSILIARELMLKRKWPFLFQVKIEEKEMALDYGYVLWNAQNLNKRIGFLERDSFSREKKNLNKIQIIFPQTDYNPSLFDLSKDIHSKFYQSKLKYHLNNVNVRKFTDQEYFVWIMQNGN